MSFSIAISGKGGTGKTTITGLIIRHLLGKGGKPVLAVDADPNSNLNETIGMEVDRTVGSTIAEFFDEKMNIPAGMSKESYLDLKMNEILVEGKGLDLLSMGRGEGVGCYCFPNLMVRKFIDELSDNYGYVVMDNQAGMEHLSRRTTDSVDLLIVVASPTVKGVRAAGRIFELVKDLGLDAAKVAFVMNMAKEPLGGSVAQELKNVNLQPNAYIPEDPNVQKFDLDRKPLLDLPGDSDAARAVSQFIESLL